MTEMPQDFQKSPALISETRPSMKNFALKIAVALGIFAAFALLAIVLWQGAEVFLLVFAGLLLAIFLRSLSDFLNERTPLSCSWALTVVLLGSSG